MMGASSRGGYARQAQADEVGAEAKTVPTQAVVPASGMTSAAAEDCLRLEIAPLC